MEDIKCFKQNKLWKRRFIETNNLIGEIKSKQNYASSLQNLPSLSSSSIAFTSCGMCSVTFLHTKTLTCIFKVVIKYSIAMITIQL